MAPLLALGRNRNSMLLWTYVQMFVLLEEVEPNGLYIALRSLTIKTYNNVASMGATKIIMINTTYIINIYIHIQNM